MSKTEVVIKEKDAKKLLDEAQTHYGQMQRSWFLFGKSLYAISVGKVYAVTGIADSFKEYCEKEFPTLNYTTMTKLVAIVESWGEAIDNRFKKDSHYVLPAYETCYTVIAADSGKIPKEEVSKLKKSVLDGKISYHRLRDAIKEYLVKHRATERDEVETSGLGSTDELEKRLTKEIEEEGGFSLRDDDDDDVEEIEADLDEDEIEEEEDVRDADLSDAITAMKLRVDYLNDNLRDLLKRVASEGASDEATELAEALEKLYDNTDKFLTKYEEINNG